MIPYTVREKFIKSIITPKIHFAITAFAKSLNFKFIGLQPV